MGDYLRRVKAKLGPAAATTATAHKDRRHFLHDGKEASRVRRIALGETRPDAREENRSSASKTSRTARLQARADRRTNRCVNR